MKTPFIIVTLSIALAALPARAGHWAPAVNPKPISRPVERGLAWIIEHQNADGGWSQGEEAKSMRASAKDSNAAAISNVADSGMATLALMRAGKKPGAETLLYADQIGKGLGFICGEVEKADADSLAVTSLRGTRVQLKIGTFVDTFVASLVLAEAKAALPDGELRTRVGTALDKVLAKIEKNQRPDGTWEGQGWAKDISQSIAGKGLNRAAQAGQPVSAGVLERSQRGGSGKFDKESGKFAVSEAAGVELYSAGNALAQMQDNANTNAADKPKVLDELKKADTDEAKAAATAKLRAIEEKEEHLAAAKSEVIKRLETDGKFLAGFGSNGGEEFLSYMNIGESLVVQGGQPWEKWDRQITDNLNHVQNEDGSWSGDHCITGRTFCTSSALLVLMVDRAPVPVAAQLKKR
jgi:hypothetical protein